jgi:PAS domain S-box-containing protein
MHPSQLGECAHTSEGLLRSLKEENEMLRNEVRVSREASEITSQLVVEQFEETYRILQLFQKTNAQLQAVLDAAQRISVIAADWEGKISLFNSGAEALLGYSASEVVGKQNLEIFHLDSELDQCAKELDQSSRTRDSDGRGVLFRCAAEGRSEELEWTYVRKDGSKFPIVMSVTPLRGPQNEINGCLCVGMDITERKRAEKELQMHRNHLEQIVRERTEELTKANEQLQAEIAMHERVEEEKKKVQAQLLQSQKMEAIGLLAGGVAHDFNNLLTTIQGYTSMVMMKVDRSGRLFKDLDQVRLSAERAANLTRQLLLFSRKQPTRPVPLNLNGIIDNLLRMLSRLIGEDVAINTRLEPDLYPILADEGNIEQVIMNLAVNARDAMPRGGELTIRTENLTLDKQSSMIISEARLGRFIRLSIADTGAGMDEETVSRIFEPFFTTKEIGKGTGLGLSVVYGIVKQHEGWINVYSQPGEGSVFNIYLPALFNESEIDRFEEMVSLQEIKGTGERILLVEDEEGVRELTARVLAENGYVVFEARDAQEARDIFESEKGNFHLILSDVVLPGQSGLELVDQILMDQAQIPILLVSGYPDQKSQWSTIRTRGVPFIQKPYTMSTLLQSVKELLTCKL